MHYAKLSGILFCAIICGTLIWKFYPTEQRVLNAKIEQYEKEVDSTTKNMESLREQRKKAEEDWKKLDNTLSWQINEWKEKVEKLNLCIEAKTLDCEWVDKKALVSFISPAFAEWTVTPANSGVPERPSNSQVPVDECEYWKMWTIEWIEFHYTAWDNWNLESIKKWHEDRFWASYIWYHYIIEKDGEVVNTRDEWCAAAADKWSKNNFRHIQVSFVWTDKPNQKQTESILKLTKLLQQKYKLPIDAVSAHSDWGPKSKNESLEYWYWSKDEFVKMLRKQYQITIYWKSSPELTYSWEAWGDYDVIGTWFQESRFNNGSVWDWWNSIWYCKIHKAFQPWWYENYKKLKSMEERLNYCHELYVYASTLPWGVGSRFHGYNAREKHVQNISIK